MALLQSSIDASIHPLVDGGAPSWATGWGEDQYGVWVEFTVGSVTQRMRWCPPGTFLMGSLESEHGRDGDEGPQHQVTLTKGFWAFDTPCTQALWVEVMHDNPSAHQDAGCPVESVTWDDCQFFLSNVSSRVPGLALSLPTEAQWEYACRAGTQTATYAGDSTDDAAMHVTLNDIAWYRENRPSPTVHPVGLKVPNGWGLYDTLGNVWEWCADAGPPYQANPRLDPVSDEPDDERIVRGGSWFSYANYVRAAFRSRSVPGGKYDYLGFRCIHVQQG